jgi:carboxylesterase
MNKPPATPIPREPFAFSGGSCACLLIHGFSGSPAEMRPLGEYLAGQGHAALGVALAGHSDNPEHLNRVGWYDWYRSVEQGFDQLRHRHPRLVVIGFSLGGALAMLLAHRRRVDRLVLLATPLSIGDGPVLRALPLLRFVVPWYYPLEKADFADPFVRRRVSEIDAQIDIDNPDVQAYLRRKVRIPVKAVVEMQRALQRARKVLPGLNLPTLLMHGRNDDIIDPANAIAISKTLAADQHELVWWEDTGHQLLSVGPARQTIYERIANFVAAP